MLGCYPIAAANENWLHESLISMIQALHDYLDAGGLFEESQVYWQSIVPATLDPINMGNLIKSTGIRDRFFSYANTVTVLTPMERERVLCALESQNRIAELLAGISNIETIESDFPDVHTAVHELFVFCFEKLTDFEVRKRQYQIIFNGLDTKICIFCGIERVMNPEETAQDQDHYLAKSIYPFAAVNMRNLVPMCRCCNRDYKKAVDVLRDAYGVRRLAFDPYNCAPPTISLANSVIEADASPPFPDWSIDFAPASQQVETWCAIFDIRTRYKRDILNEYYGKWLTGFKSKCARDRQRGRLASDLSLQEIRQVLADYSQDKADSPNIGMAGFLEPLVFELLLILYDQGNEKIIHLIRDSVLGTEMEETA